MEKVTCVKKNTTKFVCMLDGIRNNCVLNMYYEGIQVVAMFFAFLFGHV